MPKPRCSEEEFVRLWERLGSSGRVAEALQMTERMVARRRRGIERRLGITLTTQDLHNRKQYRPTVESQRATHTLTDGTALIFSDAHYWPGEPTVAHTALLALCRKLQPKLVIANGDVVDGATISRHPKAGWEKLPTVIDELSIVKTRLGEVERAAKGATLLRTRGNHDARFEYHLAQSVPEFAEVEGFRLGDHLRSWAESWSVFINETVVVKHRQANGLHAAYNNTLRGGLSMVTGHLHSLKVTPWTDYRGTRYGIDTGTLADPFGPQFEYLEDGARNWRSGFAVLTFRAGKLLPPELCEVLDGVAYFRGAEV